VSTEPTAELLGDLFLRSGRICKAPVIVKPKKTATVATTDESPGSAKSSSSKGRKTGKKQAAKPPAAPPPDISGGIGIGGVF
jgi:hypothetical protein